MPRAPELTGTIACLTDPIGKDAQGNPIYNPKAWHYRALHLHFLGETPTSIARQLKRSMQHVQGVLRTPWAQAETAKLHETLMAQRKDIILEPIQKFNSLIEEKIQILDTLTKHEDPKIALAAVREWINHTLGTPVSRSKISVEHTLNGRSVEELRFIRDNGRLPQPGELIQLAGPTPGLPDYFTAEQPLPVLNGHDRGRHSA